MNRNRMLCAALALLALALAAPALAGSHEAKEGADYHSNNDIVDVASDAGSFDTLVDAVQAAGLVETLKGEGPFTVFAPTDEAFAKIPKDQLDTLLADREQLVAVLTYHVVPGRVTAAEMVDLESAKTVQGQSIRIRADGAVRVDGASVVQADIPASNGVIHAIDSVITPDGA